MNVPLHKHLLAWRVDFNLALTSFESNIRGLRNLVNFALSSPLTEPARIVFTSSVGTLRSASILTLKLTDFEIDTTSHRQIVHLTLNPSRRHPFRLSGASGQATRSRNGSLSRFYRWPQQKQECRHCLSASDSFLVAQMVPGMLPTGYQRSSRALWR